MEEKKQEAAPANFIHAIIEKDIEDGLYGSKAHTRFPPEPNGYLHIGHAKSICLNFRAALKYKGLCNLRFDDTNPEKESGEYTESIMKDVRWLGFDWGERLFYTSDYFEKLYAYAETLIRKGLAYVDDQTPEEIRENRGTLTEPGKDSPFRNRTPGENMELFHGMRGGEYPDGAKVLRAKIDMSHPNITMRDPALYRIKRANHHRTADKWRVYPMYDFAHCLSDSIEGITHSLCTLEFENNRPLYDWILLSLEIENPPKQIEFARLNLTHTVLSKRKLLRLVEEKLVDGWDDPRMPTLSGLRRRGYTPESIKDFCGRIGVAKTNSVVNIALLEHCLREDLNLKAKRVMAVLDPVKVVIANYPDGKTEEIEAVNNPANENAGTRKIPFSKEIYIERSDFMEEPPKKFFRLGPGREVRLKHAYYIKCESFKKDSSGKITEILCSYDPATRGGDSPDGRKVKGTLQWVSSPHAVPLEVRLYEHLFTDAEPENADKDFVSNVNPDSLKVATGAFGEPCLGKAKEGDTFQFMRTGYFCADKDTITGKPVFNRTASLRDSWAKISKSK
ncbi:MAG: glutamine--tRNA ligase/YqeY domain fusion protein [Elusimicrobiota bacterium]|nr:glutamine--tRNA ligase/YqeY domain fusion protein [Elusimicrobiota bacterium]